MTPEKGNCFVTTDPVMHFYKGWGERSDTVPPQPKKKFIQDFAAICDHRTNVHENYQNDWKQPQANKTTRKRV